MKSTKLMLITILCLILSSLSGCKKDIVESLLKNNSYVECIINTRVRDKDCVKNRVKRAKIVRFTLC